MMKKKLKNRLKIDIECFDLIKWFVLVLWCDAFVVIVLPDEPRQNQARGLVDRKLVKAPPPPVILLQADLLFWFYGDFRCGVPFIIVILDIYKCNNR